MVDGHAVLWVPLFVGIFALIVGITILILRKQIARSGREQKDRDRFDREPQPILRGGVGTTPILTVTSAVVTGVVAIAVGAAFILRSIF